MTAATTNLDKSNLFYYLSTEVYHYKHEVKKSRGLQTSA